jgi:hypothetical protein
LIKDRARELDFVLVGAAVHQRHVLHARRPVELQLELLFGEVDWQRLAVEGLDHYEHAALRLDLDVPVAIRRRQGIAPASDDDHVGMIQNRQRLYDHLHID